MDESSEGDAALIKYLRDLQPRRGEEAARLLKAMKARLPQLKTLLAEVSSMWGYEDPIYRLYHQSFKVYNVQPTTQRIVAELQALAPLLKLNPDFEKIVAEGTGKQFDESHNEDWLRRTRPMIEAFFHARYFLEMAVKYGTELNEPQQPMPSGWAALLYLYNLR
jgi:hypothetical protein